MRRAAFSLIELSIVLVILGLLAGGILAGQSLIRAAELRAITADMTRYATALQTFRDKYFALPGDFRDATRFWGFSGTGTSPGCVTNSSAPSASPGTCDGNGDGFITVASAANATGELFQAWKQLALAGLVEGTYTGNSGNLSGNHFLPGRNSPTARISPSVTWMLSYHNNTTSPSGHMLNLNYTNWIGVGDVASNGGNDGSWGDDGFLKNEEAWNIDMKFDDGNARQGKMHAMGFDTGCTTSTSGTDRTTTYNLSDTRANACSLLASF
jgi:prepilin-type N-terminal cleavage/methylation domain-containing protein